MTHLRADGRRRAGRDEPAPATAPAPARRLARWRLSQRVRIPVEWRERTDWVPLDTTFGQVLRGLRLGLAVAYPILVAGCWAIYGLPFDRSDLLLWIVGGLAVRLASGATRCGCCGCCSTSCRSRRCSSSTTTCAAGPTPSACPRGGTRRSTSTRPCSAASEPDVWLQEHLEYHDVRWYDVRRLRLSTSRSSSCPTSRPASCGCAAGATSTAGRCASCRCRSSASSASCCSRRHRRGRPRGAPRPRSPGTRTTRPAWYTGDPAPAGCSGRLTDPPHRRRTPTSNASSTRGLRRAAPARAPTTLLSEGHVSADAGRCRAVAAPRRHRAVRAVHVAPGLAVVAPGAGGLSAAHDGLAGLQRRALRDRLRARGAGGAARARAGRPGRAVA